MKYLASLMLAVALGCATTPSVGSRVWHEQRLAEIDVAYNDWQIDEDEYLALKNEADAIRGDYLDRLERRRARYRMGFGIGYGYHNRHYFGYGHYHGYGHHW